MLSDLKGIFGADPKNNGKQMTIDVFSCHGGAVKHGDPDVKLTLHSGKKYKTLAPMGTSEILTAIITRKIRKTPDAYQSFMQSLTVSPETIVFSEGGHRFKAAAPKKALSANENLEKYLRGTLKAFLEFRRDKLGHQLTDSEINKKVKEFPISKDALQRYNDLSGMA